MSAGSVGVANFGIIRGSSDGSSRGRCFTKAGSCIISVRRGSLVMDKVNTRIIRELSSRFVYLGFEDNRVARLKSPAVRTKSVMVFASRGGHRCGVVISNAACALGNSRAAESDTRTPVEGGSRGCSGNAEGCTGTGSLIRGRGGRHGSTVGTLGGHIRGIINFCSARRASSTNKGVSCVRSGPALGRSDVT